MKALTVQQPWAWAIIHGGKDVENRTQRWSYRGPLAIHAGARLSEHGCVLVPELLDRTRPDVLAEYAGQELSYGAIIGTAQLVGVHTASPWCCDSPWAERGYVEHRGRERRDIVHLVLEDPHPVDPIRCTGRLGLWTPPAEVVEALEVSGV